MILFRCSSIKIKNNFWNISRHYVRNDLDYPYNYIEPLMELCGVRNRVARWEIGSNFGPLENKLTLLRMGLSDFRVVEALGKGSFASVYKVSNLAQKE